VTPEKLADIERRWAQRYGTDTVTEHGTVVRELCAALRGMWKRDDAWADERDRLQAQLDLAEAVCQAAADDAHGGINGEPDCPLCHAVEAWRAGREK
jgi:hypothetical protein